MKKLTAIIIVILIILGIIYFTNKNKVPMTVTPVVNKTETTVTKNNNQVCYYKETKGTDYSDYAFISVNYNTYNNNVYGIMNWLPGEKDSLVGAYTGTVGEMQGSKMLNIIYTASGEGIVNRQQEVLIIGANDIKQGFGAKYQDKDGVWQLKDITKLTYDNPLPKVDCNIVPDRIKANYSKQSDILTTKYIHSQNPWPPKVSTTKGTFSCKEDAGTGDVKSVTTKKTINDSSYCVTTESEGAAGSTYTTYTYTTALGLNVAKLSFVLQAVQCMNYDNPEQAECLDERKSFDPDTIADAVIHNSNYMQ